MQYQIDQHDVISAIYPQINPQQIIDYGYSLGSGAAIDLAAHQLERYIPQRQPQAGSVPA